jgi:hypothetical protein
MPISATGLNVPLRDVVRVGQVMINKAKIYKKYPFKQMQSGDAFKLDRCKRPINIVIAKGDDGYHCRRKRLSPNANWLLVA